MTTHPADSMSMPRWIPAIRELRRGARSARVMRAIDDEVLCCFRAMVADELHRGVRVLGPFESASAHADELLAQAVVRVTEKIAAGGGNF